MHRRAFVHTLGAALAAPIVGCALPASGAAAQPARRLKRVGLQLYSLRDAAEANLDRTLGEIAAIGYKDVEMLMSMRNFGSTPAQVRAMLDRHGLRAPSTHIGMANLADMSRTLDEANVLGHKYVIFADVPAASRKSLDGFRAFADRLNVAGEVTRKQDVWVATHCEPQDFVSIDGKIGYDALMERIDPKVVRAQLDIGNVVMGGRDPIPYLEKYGDHYWSFHIKDAPSLGSPRDAELGKGIVDLRGVLSRIRNIDEKFLYVEQETYPGAPVESVRRDFAFLSELSFSNE